jgi:uncharacterized membrane protein YkvA (DUF1232 family)
LTSVFRQILKHWRERARGIKREAHAVYLASKDPRVPWYAKALAVFVLAYLFSPVDLIPDFIPVLGYLDDLIVVPAGLVLVIRLIPPDVMDEHREAARVAALERRPNWVAAAVIVAIWFLLLALAIRFVTRRLRRASYH